MNLAEWLQTLSVGPLEEQPIGGSGSGVVPVENIPKIVLRLNNALTALYTRFPLQIRQIVIATVDGRYNYPLEQRFAQTSASTEPVKFIQDTVAEPYLGDFLKLQAVYDALHAELPINDKNDPLSWHQTAYDTLTMDYPLTGTSFFVEYRAQHARIPLVPVDPTEITIRIPPALESALLHHVAGHLYGNMSMEGAMAKSQAHLLAYESECAFHEASNTFVSSTDSANRKPTVGGWT